MYLTKSLSLQATPTYCAGHAHSHPKSHPLTGAGHAHVLRVLAVVLGEGEVVALVQLSLRTRAADIVQQDGTLGGAKLGTGGRGDMPVM